jgi:hypothetical protein
MEQFTHLTQPDSLSKKARPPLQMPIYSHETADYKGLAGHGK